VPDERPTIQHAPVVRQVDPEQGVTRFYSLLIVRDLSGMVRLVRNRGRIGTNGREFVEVFATENEAGVDFEPLAKEKRRRGY
jgi:predicted DNA-binding WGR domain protein